MLWMINFVLIVRLLIKAKLELIAKPKVTLMILRVASSVTMTVKLMLMMLTAVASGVLLFVMVV